MSLATLEITVKSFCSNNCTCCPQKKFIAAYGNSKDVMTLRNFRKIIDTIPADNFRLDFGGFCEPFLHDDIADMINYAYDSKAKRICLYTTLVGLTEDKAEKLKGVPFDEIGIHCPENKNFIFDNQEWIRLHKIFDTHFNGHRSYVSLEAPVSQEILNEVRGRVDVNTILSRAGNNWSTPQRLHFKCNAWGTRYDHNVVMPNGDVYLCCMDWSLKHKIGNLLEQSWDELNRKQDFSLCWQCEWSTSDPNAKEWWV